MFLPLALTTAASAESLFYGGDMIHAPTDGYGGAVGNQTNFSTTDRLIFDNFVVPIGKQWTLDAITAHIVYNGISGSINNSPNTVNGYYEIRSGMAIGNSGSVVHSGSVAAAPGLPPLLVPPSMRE